MKALHKLVQGESLDSDIIGTNLLVHLKVPLVLPELVVDDQYLTPKTTNSRDPSEAWVIDFAEPFVFGEDKDQLQRVWPVRGGR